MIVFPTGMYATASVQLGAAAGLPLVRDTGTGAAWLAAGAWTLTFAAMIVTLFAHVRPGPEHCPARRLQIRHVSPPRGGQDLGCPVLWVLMHGPQLVQLRSRRRKAISSTSKRAPAATGMATRAPTIPSRVPPIRTATKVTMAGTCTVRPMTRGTIR